MKKSVKKRKKRIAKLKKTLSGLLALVMVVGLTIVGTLAYLSTTSDTVTNVFTATDNIYLKLIEPGFDPEEAAKFKPDGEYPKDPTLVNTTGGSSATSEWGILRVDYMIAKNGDTYGNISFADITHNQNMSGSKLDASAAKGLLDFKNFATTPNNDWVKVNTSWLTESTLAKIKDANNNTGSNALCEFYIYKKVLTSDSTVTKGTADVASAVESKSAATTSQNGCKSMPLFDSVTIKSQAQLEHNGFSMESLPKFKIDIVGGAIKNEGDDVYIEAGLLNFAEGSGKITDTKTAAIVDNLVSLLADKAPKTTVG